MFPIIDTLQYSRFSDYGKNLLHNPCRIISPYSNILIDKETEKYTIVYSQPNGNCSNIVCKTNILVPEPYCYLQGNNTFLQSFLCIIHKTYIDNIHLPKKSLHIMKEYMKKVFSSFSSNSKYHKCIQKFMYDTEIITDPHKNIYFSEFCKILFEYNNCECITICSDENGYFSHTIPKSIPQENKTYIVLLQRYTGAFAPYGIYKK